MGAEEVEDNDEDVATKMQQLTEKLGGSGTDPLQRSLTVKDSRERLCGAVDTLLDKVGNRNVAAHGSTEGQRYGDGWTSSEILTSLPEVNDGVCRWARRGVTFGLIIEALMLRCAVRNHRMAALQSSGYSCEHFASELICESAYMDKMKDGCDNRAMVQVAPLIQVLSASKCSDLGDGGNAHHVLEEAVEDKR